MLFWRKKVKTNLVELKRVILNKLESVYFFYNEFNKRDFYGIHAVVRKVPIELGPDGITAKVRYIGIPNIVVYFIIKISNIEDGYISAYNTIDVNINAIIKGNKCKEAKFELLPVYDKGGALACM